VSDVISTSSYGNPGIGSCGVGTVSEVGVIGFGDEGVGVVDVVVVTFFIVFGIPHIFDSVVLTNLSFGLLGSHLFDFSSGETVILVGDGVTWAWLTLIIPISNTALAAAATTATITNAIPADLIIVFIFSIYHDLQYF
jgi:hypothetical protein